MEKLKKKRINKELEKLDKELFESTLDILNSFKYCENRRNLEATKKILEKENVVFDKWTNHLEGLAVAMENGVSIDFNICDSYLAGLRSEYVVLHKRVVKK